MITTVTKKLVVAISSRALFDLDDSHTIYEQKGVAAYADYQISHENKVLQPGAAFPLVKKLLELTSLNSTESLVEIILLSRNSTDTGLRIFNSIQQHKLNISCAAFTSGESPYRYIAAFGAHLFLSANPEDVKQVLNAGCAAATIFSAAQSINSHPQQIRIAFDGDAVLFSDESERIYQNDGLDAFHNNEVVTADTPLPSGPFKGFLTVLHHLQTQFPVAECPIRTALVTARSAPAHERVIRTLRSWGIRIDEALFLGGRSKGDFLKAFCADFFFDDHPTHCKSASQHVATGHVPHGIVNEE